MKAMTSSTWNDSQQFALTEWGSTSSAWYCVAITQLKQHPAQWPKSSRMMSGSKILAWKLLKSETKMVQVNPSQTENGISQKIHIFCFSKHHEKWSFLHSCSHANESNALALFFCFVMDVCVCCSLHFVMDVCVCVCVCVYVCVCCS